MRVKMVQYAVGQGGMFGGDLSLGDHHLRWAYDCGSNQRDFITREIGLLASEGDLDYLFLSHLDSDHAGDIDRLLERVKVREVVLPYLNMATFLATIARDISTGSLSGLFLEAVDDLPSWFGSRGVQVVTFATGDDDGDAALDRVALAPTPDGGGGEGDIRTVWTISPEPVDAPEASGSYGAQPTGGRARMQKVAPGATIGAQSGKATLNWVLAPYTHVPSARLTKAFKDALDTEFGPLLDMKAIAQLARDKANHARLRACYDDLWSDHNLVSMTLYCGPIDKVRGRVEYRFQRFLHHRRVREGGWMLTGDAHLDGLRRRQRFLKYYEAVTPLVNVFMLPHHGSIHNHSDAVLDAMPNLAFGYAAAGPNIYDHPSSQVEKAVSHHPSAQFHQVSEVPWSRLAMHVGLP